MKTIALILPLLALAACGSEPAPQPTATPTATVVAKATLPAPDKETFTALFAAACPKAEKINDAICKRAGFGSEEVTCKYSLGEDKYLRDEATLTPGDGAWALNDATVMCETHLKHHAG